MYRHSYLMQQALFSFILQGDMSDHVQKLRSTAAYRWFDTRNVRAFYNSVVAPNLRIGAQLLMQVCILIMG